MRVLIILELISAIIVASAVLFQNSALIIAALFLYACTAVMLCYQTRNKKMDKEYRQYTSLFVLTEIMIIVYVLIYICFAGNNKAFIETFLSSHSVIEKYLLVYMSLNWGINIYIKSSKLQNSLTIIEIALVGIMYDIALFTKTNAGGINYMIYPILAFVLSHICQSIIRIKKL